MYEWTPLTLQALQPLTPGSGQQGEGLADILVTRESQRGFPVINGKALKGAIRAHVAKSTVEASEGTESSTQENALNDAQVTAIFGSDIKQESEKGTQGSHPTSSGRVMFQDAFILAIPLTGGGESGLHRPIWVTCHRAMANMIWTMEQWIPARKWAGDGSTKKKLDNLKGKIDNLKSKVPKGSFVLFTEDGSDCILKEMKGTGAKIKSHSFPLKDFCNSGDPMLPTDWALVDDDLFSDLTQQHLPIEQGNRVSDKGSDALYYYETLPRGTLFWTIMGIESGFVKTKSDLQKAFNKLMKCLECPLQIGAKESSGHGHVLVMPFESKASNATASTEAIPS